MKYVEINGWKIYFHQCFLTQIIELAERVAELKAEKPSEYKNKKETKLLRAIEAVIEERIAVNPIDAQFRHGGALGSKYKHWFRAKFLMQFRLFYRCSEKEKTIIIGWVNDFGTLRAYNSKTDAYKVFAGMLQNGQPPDDWAELLKAVRSTTATTSIPGFLTNRPSF